MLPEGWRSPDPAEQAAREAAYQRLATSARRAGYTLERLHAMLAAVARNESETRRFLAEEVYGISDDNLDEVVRVRMKDLRATGGRD